MTAAPEPTGPFRWDLVSPDQLGSLLDTTPQPNLWFLAQLIECAGRVLARSANADLYFVGRSPDSIFDLLTGALARTTWHHRCHRLPLSLWSDPDALTPAQVTQFRTNLQHLGLAPHHLVRRQRPVAFVDLVHGGRTYQNLFHLLRTWMAEEPAAWSVIRTKLRFIGITARTKTSPNTWRWYQAAPWATHVPRKALVSVSLDRWIWSYLADQQHKITRSFPVSRWLAPDTNLPARDPNALGALAEALALVTYGRSPKGRTTLAAAITGEPTMRQPWLRSLVIELRRATT